MFSRIHRLTARHIGEIMEKGRVVHSPLFVLRWIIPRVGLGNTWKMAAIVPQKIAKTAVSRNKTKRRIYGALHAADIKLMNGVHAAIFAKIPALTSTTGELQASLKEVFTKAGIIS